MNEGKPAPIENDRAIGRGSAALVVVTLIAGVVNYVYTTGMAALLTPAEFVVFVAAQALLFMIGTAASAGVPWFLARRLADTIDAAPANAAVSFSLVVNTLLAVVASAVALIVVGSLGSPAEAGAAGIAAAAVCIGSTTVGILMGRGRAVALSAFRFGEVMGRAIFGAIAVLVGFGAAGAIGATAVGSLFFLIPLIPALTQYRPSVDGLRRGNWWQALGGHVSVQLALAIFAAVDIIVVTTLDMGTEEAAGYQLAMTIGRIPFFYALALGVAAFSSLVHRPEHDTSHTLLRRYLIAALPVTMIAATVPSSMLQSVFPDLAETVSEILPIAALTGLVLGGCALLTVRFQAAERLGLISLLLLTAAALLFPAAATANSRGGATGVALAVLIVVLAALVGSLLAARSVGLELQMGRLRLPPWLLLAVLLIPVGSVLLWLAIVAVLLLLVALDVGRDLLAL